MNMRNVCFGLATLGFTACRLDFEEHDRLDGSPYLVMPPVVISAYLGVVNQPAIPFCPGGQAGQLEGLPIVVSQQLDSATIVASYFSVTNDLGMTTIPSCATLAPANEPDEDNTILLAGDFVPRLDVMVTKVSIVGPVLSTNGASLAGTNVETVIGVGHSIHLAEAYVTSRESSEIGAPQGCPSNTQQVIRASWTGGLRLTTPPSDPLTSIIVRDAGGTILPSLGVSAAEEQDNDNILDICLATTEPPAILEVAAASYLAPNGLANAATTIEISR